MICSGTATFRSSSPRSSLDARRFCQLLTAALFQPCSIERVRFGADVEPPDRLLCIAYPLHPSGRDNPSALPVWWLVCRKVLASFVFFDLSSSPF